MRERALIFAEFKGGLESATHGFSSTIGPLLIFVSFFGTQSLAAAIWATLVSASVVPALGLLFRSHPAIHTSTRTASLTAYAALVLQLAMSGAGADMHGSLPTAAQWLSGLAAGSLLYALGSLLVLMAGLFRLGNIFKMIPSPVSAGISNSTAALLVFLAFKQVMGNVGQAGLVALLMVIIFGAWTALQRRFRLLHFAPNVAIALLAGLAMSYWVAPSAAMADASVHDGLSWTGLSMWLKGWDQQHLGHLLLLGLPGALTLALVMILESFTTINVMESRFGMRIHANRELISMGGANLVGAMLGGVPCTSSSTRGISNWLAGGRGRWAAVIGLALSTAVVLGLGSWLVLLPAGVIAGLFLLQAPLMVDPSFKARLFEMVVQRRWQKTGSADLGFWIAFVITLAGVFGNLIWACFLGVGLSCLAVLRRVSGSLTSRWAYLDQHRSRRVRSLEDIQLLEQAVHQVGVLQLSGHLFFGNSSRLMQLEDELHGETDFVSLDVSRVHDVDASGLDALLWLIRALVDKGLYVVVSGTKQTASVELRDALTGQSALNFVLDLDRGIEACENKVLQRLPLAAGHLQSVPAVQNLLLKDIGEDDLTAVLMMLEPRELQQGEALFHQYEEANGIWLLESGMVSILSGTDNASRLATFGPGQFVGEMGFVDGQSRSATALADTPLRAVLLDNQGLAALALQHPGAALKITLNIARELSHRMRNTSARQAQEGVQSHSGWANSELQSSLSRY